jgi:hypothetical protein
MKSAGLSKKGFAGYRATAALRICCLQRGGLETTNGSKNSGGKPAGIRRESAPGAII